MRRAKRILPNACEVSGAGRRALIALKWMSRLASRRVASLLLRSNCDWIVLGEGSGAWRVCPTTLGSGSVVYSFGVGNDISFDLALIDRFDVELHAFDPTPRSVEWVRSQSLPERFHFHPVGIYDRDGMMTFHPPSRSDYVSYSVVARGVLDDVVEVPVQRLETILDDLGHSRVDLVKLDVEGAEYAVIDDLVARSVPIAQLLVEFHDQWREFGAEHTKAAVRALTNAGFRLFAVSPSDHEYCFIRAGEGSS